MGQVLGAVCECGYKGSAALGAGRSNFREVCNFPHYCKSCEEVVSVDIFKDKQTCPKCKSEDVHTYEAQTTRLKNEVHEQLSDLHLERLGLHRRTDEQDSWYGKDKSHILLRGPHRCPKCQMQLLKFFTELMFD
jgi:predicted Zn-ribbon and HTH transcriptional regulator